MAKVIKFTDVDVDGYGTNIEVCIQVEGGVLLTSKVIEETKEVIERYKNVNQGYWDTDSVIGTACDYLKTKGYKCQTLVPDYNIEF